MILKRKKFLTLNQPVELLQTSNYKMLIVCNTSKIQCPPPKTETKHRIKYFSTTVFSYKFPPCPLKLLLNA